jgi:hypothetical protein
MTPKRLFAFLIVVYKSFLEACEDPLFRGATGAIVSVFVGMYFRSLPQPFGQIVLVGSLAAGLVWLVYSMWANSSARCEQRILERAVREVGDEEEATKPPN